MEWDRKRECIEIASCENYINYPAVIPLIRTQLYTQQWIIQSEATQCHSKSAEIAAVHSQPVNDRVRVGVKYNLGPLTMHQWC